MAAMTDSPTHTFWRGLTLGFRSMREHPSLAAVFLAATLSQGALQGLLVLTMREVLRAFSGDGESWMVFALGATTILGLWLLRAVGTFAGELVSARLAHRVEIDWMQRVLRKLLLLPVRFFERSSQGDLVMTTYQDLRGVRTVTQQVGTVVLSASRMLGLAAVAWMISPKLALIGLVAVPAGCIPAYRLGQRITKAARAARLATQTLYDSFLQISTGIRVIKVNRGERTMLDRAREIGEELFHYLVHDAKSKNLARLYLEAVAGLGLIAVLVVGGRDVAMGTLDWESLLSLLIAVMALYSPVLSLLSVYTSIRHVIPLLDRVDTLLATPVEVEDVANACPLRHAPATIELHDVSFGYDDRQVLRGVSATFHRGETIGIVGPSGAGKSTLIGLLLRLYDPTRGRILYDGTDLREVRHGDLMDMSAIVLQEPFLFLDTIANNIRMARPEASMDEVIRAAQAAGIHDEIIQMELGYETVIGRRRDARGVSVGQKQRISIAAALLKNAPILFLDEATSNLDSVSERAVQQAVERLMAGRTSFVIAHRLSTLRRADRIMVLDEGRVVGLGTHDELIEACPLYRLLWQAQHLGEGAETDADLDLFAARQAQWRERRSPAVGVRAPDAAQDTDEPEWAGP
jgi:ABC-type multidrug transport system fused ATPase/permease subunit